MKSNDRSAFTGHVLNPTVSEYGPARTYSVCTMFTDSYASAVPVAPNTSRHASGRSA